MGFRTLVQASAAALFHVYPHASKTPFHLSLSLSLSELLWRRFRLQDDDADTDGAQPQQQQSAEPASMATVGGEHQPLISDGDENERTMLLGHAAVPQYKGKPHTCAPPRPLSPPLPICGVVERHRRLNDHVAFRFALRVFVTVCWQPNVLCAVVSNK